MSYPYETVFLAGMNSQVIVTLPVNPGPAKYTIKRMGLPMANTTIAFRVTGSDGSDLGLVEATTVQFSDGVITFSDKLGVAVAYFNQDAVRGWVPVSETEAPELIPGAYTFEVEIGEETRRVIADEYVYEVLNGGDEPFVTALFRTKVGAAFRKELSLNAADIKAIVRLDPATAVEGSVKAAKGSVKKTV